MKSKEAVGFWAGGTLNESLRNHIFPKSGWNCDPPKKLGGSGIRYVVLKRLFFDTEIIQFRMECRMNRCEITNFRVPKTKFVEVGGEKGAEENFVASRNCGENRCSFILYFL